ncbi:hypothetical protein ADIAG_00629 [Paeniglutamicibacter gangotriensis Lz1y]|uniref:Uncharacterized protein n=1 Tax=Paeniglutamicibacter gangotriensis Lz1y TaxID=1276920 RepID=M7NCI0_9MICC|nr:hypothetical protein ADIAG_00629 [Paeniglutamicibacter gangotriensis Lz1y]
MRFDTTPTMLAIAGVNRNFLDIPVPGTGYLQLDAAIMLKLPTSSTPLYADIQGQFAIGPRPSAGGSVPVHGQSTFAQQISKHSTDVGCRVTLNLSGWYFVDAPKPVRVQVQVQLAKRAGTSARGPSPAATHGGYLAPNLRCCHPPAGYDHPLTNMSAWASANGVMP